MASGASALHCRLLFAKLQKLAIVKTCDGPAFPKQGVINIVMDDCKRRKRVAASEQLHNLSNFVIMTQIAEVYDEVHGVDVRVAHCFNSCMAELERLQQQSITVDSDPEDQLAEFDDAAVTFARGRCPKMKRTMLYNHLQRDDAIKLLELRDKELQTAIDKCSSVHKQLARSRLARSRSSVSAPPTRGSMSALVQSSCPNKSFELVRNVRPGRKSSDTSWLTHQSRFAAALRRTVSRSSANRFGTGALVDISRQTIVRCECNLVCALNSSLHSWYAQQEADIMTVRHRMADALETYGDEFGFAVHVIKSDATNSNIIMNSKIQATVVESYYLQSLDGIGRGMSMVDAASYRRGWTDTVRVGGGSAQDLAALIDKQLQGVGCTSVSSHVLGDANPYVVRVFLYTSDGGADQMSYRRACIALAADRLMVWWIDISCLVHVHHLAVKEGMKVVNRWCRHTKTKWLYMSSLSKVVHCIRDQARPFFIEWKRIHGEASALELAATKPPQCIAGRWGTIEATGDWCLKRRSQIPGVVTHIVQKKITECMPKLPGKKKQRMMPIAAEDHLLASVLDDDCAAATIGADTAEYRKKIGQWRQDTLDVINSNVWWHAIEIAHEARAPLDHFYNFMNVPIDRGEPMSVQLLLTGKVTVLSNLLKLVSALLLV